MQSPQQLADTQPQRQPLPLLLSSISIPPVTLQLQINPGRGSLQTWQDNQTNQMFYSARLISNAQHPESFVGIGVHDLVCHSHWAATKLQQPGTQPSSLHLTLPVCTNQGTVYKLVQALYSGVLPLGDDTEQVLMLANSIQVYCQTTTSIAACTLTLHSVLQHIFLPMFCLPHTLQKLVQKEHSSTFA